MFVYVLVWVICWHGDHEDTEERKNESFREITENTLHFSVGENVKVIEKKGGCILDLGTNINNYGKA